MSKRRAEAHSNVRISRAKTTENENRGQVSEDLDGRGEFEDPWEDEIESEGEDGA